MKINYYYIDSNKVPSYYENFRDSLKKQLPNIFIASTREELLKNIKNTPGPRVVITDEEVYVHGEQNPDPNWIMYLRELSKQVDVVFSLNAEMFKTVAVDTYADIIKECPNVYFITPGYINDPAEPNKYLSFQFWINELNWTYNKRELKNECQHLTPYDVKSKAFDILLGHQKMHRDFLYNFLLKEPLVAERNQISYFKSSNCAGWENFQFDKKIISDVYPEKFQTGRTVKYQVNSDVSVKVRLSFIIPNDIYNQTNFTVVSETNYDNEFSFYTEKTAKPILARRMFVALSGHRFLENLRQEGFRTFEGIIDESYDLEPDYIKRWTMVYEQIKKISLADPAKILEKARPIVDHNHRIMTQTDWCAKTIKQIEKRATRHLKSQ